MFQSSFFNLYFYQAANSASCSPAHEVYGQYLSWYLMCTFWECGATSYSRFWSQAWIRCILSPCLSVEVLDMQLCHFLCVGTCGMICIVCTNVFCTCSTSGSIARWPWQQEGNGAMSCFRQQLSFVNIQLMLWPFLVGHGRKLCL